MLTFAIRKRKTQVNNLSFYLKKLDKKSRININPKYRKEEEVKSR